MAETKISRRDQIKELIETGDFTKKEIAAKIGIKDSGVSSQLTYLRWMGFFITFNEDKKLNFTTEEGYAEWEATKKAGRKTKVSVSKKTPQEQYVALEKTIKSQTKSLAVWADKAGLLAAEDQEDETLLPEANANITLLGIKLGGNQVKFDALEVPEEDEVDEVDEVEEEELL